MEKRKLLFVEDDIGLCYVFQNSLQLTNRYTVEIAINGKEGIEKYRQFNPDVIVSDIIMPGMSGLKMVEEIRKTDHSIPIILVSGEKKEQADIVYGLQLRVDNYIQKPLIPEVLDWYIKALFRKETKEINKESCRIGDFVFDIKRQTLQLGDKFFHLTTREANVLRMIWFGKGNLVKRNNILFELWGNDYTGMSRSLDVCISNLRKILRKDPSVQIITIRNEGFNLLVK